MFEECYNELLSLPKYEEIRNNFSASVSSVHNGYFSQDRKGIFKDTKGDTLADYDTYNTIMKEKEWLLSFECPLRFIFSHSALKEGWDNPNVFQVCTLIEQKSTFTCRQKVGRGLRLCVNQDGERIEDKNINILHVMASESFAEFAETLQKEIETETGVKFGVMQISMFSGMAYTEEITQEKQVNEIDAKMIMDYMVNHDFATADGKPTEKAKAAVVEHTVEIPPQLEEVKDKIAAIITQGTAVTPESLIGATYIEKITVEKTVSYEEAVELMNHFEKKDYISKSGRQKDTMKNAPYSDTLDLPEKYETARKQIETICKRADNKPPIHDVSKQVAVKLNKQAFISTEFLELWNKIKQKTTYRVQIDTEKLVTQSIKDLQDMPTIPKARLVSQTADYHLENRGVSYTECEIRTQDLKNTYKALPNILSIISEETLIKRSTVQKIIEESGRSKEFLGNPQAFMEKSLEIIKKNRHALAIDGIRYVKLDDKEYYAQEIFDSSELIAYIDKDAVAVEHSVYDYVIYDSSTIEKPFAIALDRDPDVKMFFKIPDKFKIETPIGTYNPDWAVYLEQNGEQKLFFVLETKGSTNMFDLRTKEQLKIHCGKQHFKALDDIELHVSKNWKETKVSL